MLERATHTIVQQVEAMQQMVNAFSEYARAPEMRITRFSLNQLVTEVADLYRSQDPRVEIRLELDERIDAIEADRGRVRQILNNLVTNALEALDGVATPRLEIATRFERRRAMRGTLSSPCVTMARDSARAPGPGVRPVRDEQAQGHGPRAGDREEDRRGAWRPDRCR